MTRARLLCIFWLLACVASFAQPLETRIFQLNNRPAEATLEMVRPLLSPTGTVLPETRLQKLIVRDTPEKLSEIGAFLAEIDQPSPQVRIFVSMEGTSPYESTVVGAGISGSTRHPRVDLTGRSDSGVSSASSDQNILVMSGERAVITVARDLASVGPYSDFCRQNGLQPPILIQSVSTGFAVEPVVVGDVVRMKITPWLGFVGPDGRSDVMIDQASTTVALRSGQETTIASGGARDGFRSSAYGLILGSASGSVERTSSIRVRPEIQAP